MTTELLSRLERLEARLTTLEGTQSPAADAATTPTPTESIAAEPSSRRDLLRYGAVALGAVAAAAGTGTSPVEAANGGAVIIGSFDNIGTLTTRVTASGGNTAGLYGESTGSPGYGLIGVAY